MPASWVAPERSSLLFAVSALGSGRSTSLRLSAPGIHVYARTTSAWFWLCLAKLTSMSTATSLFCGSYSRAQAAGATRVASAAAASAARCGRGSVMAARSLRHCRAGRGSLACQGEAEARGRGRHRAGGGVDVAGQGQLEPGLTVVTGRQACGLPDLAG